MTFKEYYEAKASAKLVYKMLQDKNEWGDFGKHIKLVNGNIIVMDSYWTGGEEALKNLKKNWSKGGVYYNYFNDELGAEFKIVSEEIYMNVPNQWKKVAGDTGGVVEIEVEVK